MITNGSVTISGEELPVFKVEVIPGEDSDPSQLDFTWTVEEMTDR